MIKVYVDGSYKSGFVGYAYSIHDGNDFVVKDIIIRKPKTSLKNVEGELAAIVSAFSKIKLLYGSLKGEKIIIASDLQSARDFYTKALKENESILKQVADQVSDKDKKFYLTCKEQFYNIVKELGCEISFEYVRGHAMNTIHNAVDSTLLKMINRRIATEMKKIATKNSFNGRKVESVQTIAYIPAHLFSPFEYEYIKKLHALLTETQSAETVQSIEFLMENQGLIYDPSDSLLKRDLKELLNDAVRYKVLICENGETDQEEPKYIAANVKEIIYRKINLHKLEESQMNEPQLKKTLSKTINQYEIDYKNFLVNILKKEKDGLTLSQIEKKTLERKNPLITEKLSKKQTLELLLEELINEKRITKTHGKFMFLE